MLRRPRRSGAVSSKASPASRRVGGAIKGSQHAQTKPAHRRRRRAFLLVRGSPFDSVGPRSTWQACFGTKRPPVHIRPPRPRKSQARRLGHRSLPSAGALPPWPRGRLGGDNAKPQMRSSPCQRPAAVGQSTQALQRPVRCGPSASGSSYARPLRGCAPRPCVPVPLTELGAAAQRRRRSGCLALDARRIGSA
jgi:hypothetical protein